MKEKFFNNYFNTLAGTDQIKKMILAGKSASEIEASWQSELESFNKLRLNYLLYK